MSISDDYVKPTKPDQRRGQKWDRAKILRLADAGLNQSQIAKKIGCSVSLVSIVLRPERGLHIEKYRKQRRSNKVLARVESSVYNANHRVRLGCSPRKYTVLSECYPEFNTDQKVRRSVNHRVMKMNKRRKLKGFTDMLVVKEVYEKVINNPTCYYSGKPIDLLEQSWELDHIVPLSRGGTNTIDNIALCLQAYNMAKGDLKIDEFIEVCRNVLLNAGYRIEAIAT